MECDRLGFSGARNVLTQVREDRADSLFIQSARRGQSILNVFTGHESRCRPPHKAVSRESFAQPWILRGREQSAAHESHAASFSGCWKLSPDHVLRADSAPMSSRASQFKPASGWALPLLYQLRLQVDG